MKDKILIYGLGISGLSALKALSRLNYNITVLDKRDKKEIEKILKEENLEKVKIISNIDEIEDYKYVIKSPGIKPEEEIMGFLYSNKYEVLTDLELASRLSDFSKTIIITGTNGKTTVTELVYIIISAVYEDVNLLGNIGKGILDIDLNKDNINVIEASSFQLYDTKELKAKYNLLLNITEDHLDWHSDYDDYVNSKLKLFRNLDEKDYFILNYDDELIRKKAKDINGQIFWFSKDNLKNGVYYKNGKIIIKDEKKIEIEYNGNIIIENILAAVAVAYLFGIDIDIIEKAINNFKPLEHRMELFKEKDEVKYINDSKATNPESTIKALENLDKNIILIAGGYNKNSDFDQLTKLFNKKLKKLILLGENKEDIKSSAEKNLFNDIIIVEDLKEAVKIAKKISVKGDTVLLSPASASWDMYKNYMIRGAEFKELIGD